MALMERFPIPMWNDRDDAISKIDFNKEPPKSVSRDKPFVKKTYKPILSAVSSEGSKIGK